MSQLFSSTISIVWRVAATSTRTVTVSVKGREEKREGREERESFVSFEL